MGLGALVSAGPADPVGAAASGADGLERLQLHQFAQITPGCGTARSGQPDGLAQGETSFEPFRFGIQQPVEQLLLARIEAVVAMTPSEQGFGTYGLHHKAVAFGASA